jgi:flavin-dependent dehydrogenase
MEKYDVVIVGSGPAGASAAKALAGSGLKTAILEKSPLPRYKMCSGILFPGARRMIADGFGPVPGDACCRPEEVEGLRGFLSIDSPCIDMPFSAMNAVTGEPDLPEKGLNIRRPQLDLWLCKQSDASILEDCMFIDYSQEGECLTLKVRYDGEEKHIESGFLLGADGPNSMVRKAAFPGFDNGLRLIPNYEEWYRGGIDLEPGWLYLFFDRSLSGFMATLFQKDDLTIAVTGAAKGRSARGYFEAFRDHLKKEHGLKIEETVERHGIALNDMSANENYCLGKGNVLIVGEAAGFLRSAEGITSALVTGAAAGEAILKSAETGGLAIDFYLPATAEEKEKCRKAHKLNGDLAGFNMFTRE